MGMLWPGYLSRYFVGYKATASGAKHQEATNHLEKKLKKDPKLNTEDTVEVISDALNQERILYKMGKTSLTERGVVFHFSF
jgi:20S proteasome subunit alpha 1